MKKLALFAITLVAPLLLVAVTISSAAYAGPATGGSLDGKTIFLESKCNLCHSVSSAGIEAKMQGKMAGPDLTGVGERHEAALIGGFLRGDAEIGGKAHKKKFTGSDEELAALIDWLKAQKAQ